MKKWLPLIALVMFQNTSIADVKLDFTRYSQNGQQASFSLLIKNSLLRIEDQDNQRFNLFDSRKKRFISLHQRSGKIARMDMDILTQRAEQLNQKRKQHLQKVFAELDKKRAQMSPSELEVSESMINQMKYPELYGAYTLNRLEKTSTQKEIAGISCQLYRLTREKRLLKTLCIANMAQLGISQQDFNTLREYEEFQYQLESRMSLAIGEADFDLVSLKQLQIDGLVIESHKQFGKQLLRQQILTKLDTKRLSKERFEIPKVQKSQLK